jgi:hypothetical protein
MKCPFLLHQGRMFSSNYMERILSKELTHERNNVPSPIERRAPQPQTFTSPPRPPKRRASSPQLRNHRLPKLYVPKTNSIYEERRFQRPKCAQFIENFSFRYSDGFGYASLETPGRHRPLSELRSVKSLAPRIAPNLQAIPLRI